MQDNSSVNNQPPQHSALKLRRRVLSLKGICVGIFSGLIAVGFRLGLEAAEKFREMLTSFSQTHIYFMILPMLIFEMTNEYYLLLPLMIVSIIAYSIPEFFKEAPIYEVLLDRDLKLRKIAL